MTEALGLVVAMARRRVIGKDGGLPWRIPEDLRWFKAVTLGHAVVMGRKTYQSIGRPLPQRRNLVISRTAPAPPGCEVARSLDEALRLARETDAMPMVIGGAAVYAEALPLVTRLYLTHIDREVEGDTYFPAYDESAFRLAEAHPGPEGVRFEVWERR